MKNTLVILIPAFTAFSALAGGWYVEGGAVCRKNLKLDLRADSHARQLGAQAARAADVRPELGSPDSPLLADDLSTGSRTFADGHVGTDASTAFDGRTGNWSFDSMSQYDAANNTLTYRVSSGQWMDRGEGYSRTVATDTSEPLRGGDDDGAAGAGLRGGYIFLERERFWVSLQMGLNVYGESESSLSGTPYAQTVTSERSLYTRTVQENWVYTYDADFGGAQLVDVRAPGTEGSPYLPAAPSGRELASVDDATARSLLSRSQQVAASRVDLDADLQLTQLVLGPRLEWELHRRLSVGLLAYLSMNVIDFSASHNEDFGMGGRSLAAWHDSESETTVAAGGGAELSLTFHVTDSIYVSVHGGYDAVFDEPGLNVGPDQIKADLDSWTCGALLGVRL